jgi:hypothetical protein
VRRKCLIFLFAICCLVLLAVANTADAQDLGHKLPGLLGLDAGRVPEPGLYLADRVVSYRADEIRDRDGNLVPTGDIQLRVPGQRGPVFLIHSRCRRAGWLSPLRVQWPVARLRVNVQDRPEASVDRFGLTDFYIQPARLGLRKSRFELVGSYSLYLPSGISVLAGGKGLSAGNVTHQFSAGARSSPTKTESFFLRRWQATI